MINAKAVHNCVMRYSSTLPGLQANTQIFGRHVFLFFFNKKKIKIFFLPPPDYGRSIPSPSPKTQTILLEVAVEGGDLIINTIVNNAVFKFKTKDDRIIQFPLSPNRNPDIWSQFLSGELTVIELGNIFTRGTMPAPPPGHG